MSLAGASLPAVEPKVWEVKKIRAAYLETADDSDAFSALELDFAEGVVSVEDKWIRELDVTYAFTKNWVAELVAPNLPMRSSIPLRPEMGQVLKNLLESWVIGNFRSNQTFSEFPLKVSDSAGSQVVKCRFYL